MFGEDLDAGEEVPAGGGHVDVRVRAVGEDLVLPQPVVEHHQLHREQVMGRRWGWRAQTPEKSDNFVRKQSPNSGQLLGGGGGGGALDRGAPKPVPNYQNQPCRNLDPTRSTDLTQPEGFPGP